MPDSSTTDAGAQGANGGGNANGAQGATDGNPGAQGAPAGGQSTDGTAAGTERPQTLAEALAAIEAAQTRATELEQRVEVRERENAEYREQRRQAEAAEEARRREGMSTEDTLRADLAERETELTQLRSTTAELQEQLGALTFAADVAPVAQQLGFRNPNLAARLVNRSTCLTADGNVDPARIRTALEAELKADPYLAQAAGTDAGAGRDGTGSGGKSVNDLIRDRAKGR